MTTPRRRQHQPRYTPRRRQQQKGPGVSRCAMFGISIVVLIILHLFAVAFLYQRAVPTKDSQLRTTNNMDTALKRSIDSLKKQSGQQKVQLNKPQKPITRGAGQEARPNDDSGRSKEHGKDEQNSHDLKEAEVAPERPRKRGHDSREKKGDVESAQSDKDKEKNALDVGGADAVVAEEEEKLDEGVVNDVDQESLEEKGNRVTDRAYIGDFEFERQHQAFRTQELVFPDLDARVESLESCGYVSNHRLLTHAACRNDDTPLTAFNSQPFSRFWCNKTIAPDSVETFDKACREPVRLFPMKTPAPVSGEGMSPIVITSTKGSDDLEDVTCDIPCQQQVGMEGLARYIEGTDWKITTTAEDPASVKIDSNAYRNDQYYSTASFQSSVPLSPFSFDNYNLSVDAVDFDYTLPSASYLIDSACSSPGSRRHRWAGAVNVHLPVAYYGFCSHNTDLPDGMSLSNREDRVQLHRKHRFNLAFESSNENDYITEVIFDAFQSGSLPVILGPANIESHFPPNSFINAGRYQSWDELGKYVKQVSENKTLWESYHTWRKDPDALNEFKERFAFTKTDATCRMCRWAYAKLYGTGWDHLKQEVKETTLSRELCVDSELVTKPFIESYVTKSDDTTEEVAAGIRDSSSCQSGSSTLQASFDLDGFHLERSIEAHDGVTDLVINHISRPAEKSGDFILQLEFGVKNDGGASFFNPHTLISTIHGPLCSSVGIQDERSKVAVLANWETELLSTKEGTIGIVINSENEGSLEDDETRRVRVIVEDADPLHDKLTEYYPSSYGKLMIRDFVDPLDFFYSTN